MKYQIDQNRCAYCMTCIEACPTGAIQVLETGVHINDQLCKACGVCAQVCPVQAIEEISENIPVYMDESGDTQADMEKDSSKIHHTPVNPANPMISSYQPQDMIQPVRNVVTTTQNPVHTRYMANGCRGGRGCGKRHCKRKKRF